jgi:hypothetical protein
MQRDNKKMMVCGKWRWKESGGEGNWDEWELWQEEIKVDMKETKYSEREHEKRSFTANHVPSA